MHRVIAQFHRFMYIFNLCMLVGQLCLKTVSTCLRGRIMGGVTPRTPRRPGVMRMTLISSLSLSLLLIIMSCHLFCICGTLFNAYDPTIETGLITLPLGPDGSSSNLRRFPGARGSVLVLYGASARGGLRFFLY
jgi:hypothetical protein